MILTEAAFLGLLAALLGLVLGFALSLLLVWCVTVLAGLYPARVAARLNPIDVIHEE